jgi:hypothetical protein
MTTSSDSVVRSDVDRGVQDRETSSRWQRQVAEETIAGRGVIVAEYFDVCSRRLPWCERPAATALLEATADSDRPFDAVAVGEYERAFYGNQFETVLWLLGRRGVRLWLPEAGGVVDVDSPVHQALLLMLGAELPREVVRARHRTLAAMRAQTCLQGRFLGGRPPYGYQLVDAGPHPNRAHARWGRQAHQLAPDPTTAPWVRWIFEQRAKGHSMAGIARELNERGVPCPSAADQPRNRHRSGEAWIMRTVAGILANPRYTGRQVWNRHGTDDTGQVASAELAHTPLIDEATFSAVQGMRSTRRTADGTARTYLLAGLLVCGICGRRMDSHWTNQHAGYRCRHGHTSARHRSAGHPKNVYIRQDHLLAGLRHRLPNDTDLDDTDVADHIRSIGMTIICSAANRWTLTEPIGVAHRAEHPQVGDQLTLDIARFPLVAGGDTLAQTTPTMVTG